jgi:hypothetical protein
LGDLWVLVEGLQDLPTNVGDLDNVDLRVFKYWSWLFPGDLGCWLLYLLSFCFILFFRLVILCSRLR